jgi:glycosyltransferase involved in cell wall biosynthesis
MRPAVDVVVPFIGPRESLEQLVEGMGSLAVREGDSITVADNRPPGAEPVDGVDGVRVIRAAEIQSSYYARNRGAAGGSGDWILFLDADVAPDDDLLDRYFDPDADERTAVLAGGVEDEPSEPDAPAAVRFAALCGAMSQGNTLRGGPWDYAQTANCAVRRSAFEQVGGFCEEVRSGGDADLCFRLRQAGWEIESRELARVIHANRPTLSKLVRQRARMGAGAAWVERRHPGSFPPARWPGLAAWTAISLARAGVAAARGRRDAAILDAIHPLVAWAFELGRLLSNSAPVSAPARTAAAEAEPLAVSVVIPAYNREQMLRRALASVRAQRRPPAEVIVVDDASTDGTARVAREFGAKVVGHDVNRGEGAARNSGIAAASQPWVALLDSDDEWLPHHLETLWAGRDGHVVVANSALRCSDDPERDRVQGAPGRPLVVRSPAEILFPENPLPLCASMVKREVAVAAGGYDSLPRCADFDFWLRCLEHGTALVRPDVGALYHLHEEQVSHAQEEMSAAHIRVGQRYADRDWYSPAQVERFRAVAAWDRYRLRGGRSARALVRPNWAPALVRLWGWRLRLRRRSAAVGRDGGPSLVLLPGFGGTPPSGFSRVYDLRDSSRPAALLALARRPAAFALAGTRLDSLAARALGVRLLEIATPPPPDR